MSIAVELSDLERKVGEYDFAYVLTVRDDLRPHVVAATPVWEGGDLTMTLGRSSTSNASARPSISLCYPPTEAGGYSLIVDGTASIGDDGILRFAPTGAVLHRPASDTTGASDASDASAGSVAGCASDCMPVTAD